MFIPVAQVSTAAVPTLRKSLPKAVNNTVAATDLFNGEFTLPAMGATTIARITAWGDIVSNSGLPAAPRFQLVVGGSTLLDTGTFTQVQTSGLHTSWRLDGEFANTGATNTQIISANIDLQALVQAIGTGAFTTGEGINTCFATGNSEIFMQGINTGAVDMTAPRLLEFRVINGAASAQIETKLYGALVEII